MPNAKRQSRRKSPVLPSYKTCALCSEIRPADEVTTQIILDGTETEICDSCAWLERGERLDE